MIINEIKIIERIIVEWKNMMVSSLVLEKEEKH